MWSVGCGAEWIIERGVEQSAVRGVGYGAEWVIERGVMWHAV